jgi:hypothetical protein
MTIFFDLTLRPGYLIPTAEQRLLAVIRRHVNSLLLRDDVPFVPRPSNEAALQAAARYVKERRKVLEAAPSKRRFIARGLLDWAFFGVMASYVALIAADIVGDIWHRDEIFRIVHVNLINLMVLFQTVFVSVVWRDRHGLDPVVELGSLQDIEVRLPPVYSMDGAASGDAK